MKICLFQGGCIIPEIDWNNPLVYNEMKEDTLTTTFKVLEAANLKGESEEDLRVWLHTLD